MANIIYISVGMTSTLNSSFELSRRLTAVGHTVSFVSHADIESQVTANGYTFHRLKRDQELQEQWDQELRSWQATTPPRPKATIAFLQKCRRLRQLSIESDEIETLVRSLRPDLLIVDLEMHFALIATASLGIPTVVPCFFFSVFRRPGVPPLHYDLEPGSSPADGLRVQAAWFRTRLGAQASLWKRRLGPKGVQDRFSIVTYGTVSFDDLREVGRVRGYDFRRQTDASQWLRPFVYRHLPIMSLNVREMDFPHEPPPNLRYVGPMVYRQRVDSPLDPADAERLSQLLQARRIAADEARPLVYCSLGSLFVADRSFLLRVINVFRRRPEWDLVLGLGRTLKADDLAPVPANVLILPWAPQLSILEVADCAIAHGGVSTINECVYFEVPMVVYSTKHVDQNGGAARVRFHRLGVAADKDADSSSDVERNIERALTEPEFKKNLAEMKRHLSRYERDGVAEKIIADLLPAS